MRTAQASSPVQPCPCSSPAYCFCLMSSCSCRTLSQHSLCQKVPSGLFRSTSLNGCPKMESRKVPACIKGISFNVPHTLPGEGGPGWLLRGRCKAGEELSGTLGIFHSLKMGNEESRCCWPRPHQRTCLLLPRVHANPSHAGQRSHGSPWSRGEQLRVGPSYIHSTNTGYVIGDLLGNLWMWKWDIDLVFTVPWETQTHNWLSSG